MIAADAVVVGAGVMGSAAAWWLARAGRDVVVLERFELGHRRGSSHGASRIFRLSYHEPRYVAMAQEARILWRDLEEESGERLVTITGGLDAGTAAEPHARAMDERGVPFEWLDPAERVRRFPFLGFDDRERVLHQPDSGIVAADRAVATFAAAARARGATFHEGTPVRSLAEEGGLAEVRTDEAAYRAPVAVITAGSWARGLLAGVSIDIPTRSTRETVAYFAIDEDLPLPTLVDWGSPAVYSLPSPGQGIKAGEHIAGPETDPDEEGRVSEESVERLRGWVARRYPGADPDPHHAETCLYTNTPDESFILERRGPWVVGSACSGHGFKFAPLVGKRLADLAGAAVAPWAIG